MKKNNDINKDEVKSEGIENSNKEDISKEEHEEYVPNKIEETPKKEIVQEETEKNEEIPKEENTEKKPFSFKGFYDKHYKIFLLLPAILLILSLAYLGYQYYSTGDFIDKDITLTGGTSITVFVENEIDLGELRNYLSEREEEFNVRELSDFRTGKQKAIIVEGQIESEEFKGIVEGFLDFELNNENSSVESTGSSLGESFYRQLQIAIVLSFILMAIVVFVIFRTFVPSFAVVISAFTDIVMTLALVDFLGVKISSAGITAILMLIGYSVDSDIMLTTRLLKRHENVDERIWNAFKTGITMTLTSIIAISVAFFITKDISNVLGQIFFILVIGLGFDILNTWVTNLSILKWYLEGGER